MLLSQCIALVICLILCLLVYGKRWLTAGGALAAFLMGLVFAFAGIATFLLPGLLLLGGTMLSRFNRDEREKHGRRALQVLANGLAGCLCLIMYMFKDTAGNEHPLFIAYLISFTISICDTFSSEAGKYFKGKTYDIIRFRPVAPGLSGGISVKGTLGGMLGAAVSAWLACAVFDLSFQNASLVFIWGFSGMLLDSVLGSMIQAKYINNMGDIGEFPGDDNRLFRGFRWCTNDVVNILSNVLLVALFLLLKGF